MYTLHLDAAGGNPIRGAWALGPLKASARGGGRVISHRAIFYTAGQATHADLQTTQHITNPVSAQQLLCISLQKIVLIVNFDDLCPIEDALKSSTSCSKFT